jgi:hypothetical protein
MARSLTRLLTPIHAKRIGRPGLSPPDRGARRAALEFRITASSNLNYFPSAEAWVDDVRVA